MAGFIITRIHVGDYDTWRSLFDKDLRRARERATAVRVFRRESGVLERFEDRHGPNVLEEVVA